MKSFPVPVRFSIILILALGVRMCMVLFTGEDPISQLYHYRPIVAALKVGPAAMLILAITYSALIAVYIKFSALFPGKGMRRGLRFGFLFALVWFFGMLEGSLVTNISLLIECKYGLFEMPSIILIGFLSEWLFGSGNLTDGNTFPKDRGKKIVCGLAGIALFCLAGRYFYYIFISPETSWIMKPVPTFLWTLGNAVLVSVIYWQFGSRLQGSILKKALVFAFVIYGIDWMCFSLVAPFLFEVSLFEVFRTFIVRVLTDCVFISLGVICVRKLD